MSEDVTRRPRRNRMLRGEQPPDDLVLVIRAAEFTEMATVDTMVDDALVSADSYVVVTNGQTEILFGISVFARPADPMAPQPMERFSRAPTFLEVPVGVIREAGFAVYPTGINPQHFDVQLVNGMDQKIALESCGAIVKQAAETLVRLAGPLRLNPFYDEADEKSEEVSE